MSNNKDFKVKNGIQPTSYFEGLGTVTSGIVGYDLANAVYDSVSFSVASQEASPTGLAFNSDGTKIYVSGFSSDSIHQYSLSTDYDISTASYDSVSFSFASQATESFGMAFNNSGTKVYILGYTSATLYQYSLSTAFDISTTSYDSVSFSVASQAADPVGMAFNNDGTKMYVCEDVAGILYQYSLSTAFDLSTASYASVSFDISDQDIFPRGLTFNDDGTKMYLVGNSNDSIYQYSLSTAFDLSTASYDSVSFSVASQDTGPTGIAFNSNGTKVYLIGVITDTIFQYSTVLTTNTLDLSTGSVFEITPTSDIQVTLSNPADSGTVSAATLLLDGAATSTYDLANASYDGVSFSVAAQDGNPRAVFFKPDGLKMYVVGNSGQDINEYTLSTAWDISTASYLQNFSIAAQDVTPTGVFFKPDGTKMYVVGDASETVYQYSTATPATITYDTAIEWSGGTAPTSPAIGETDVLTFNTTDGGTTYQAVQAIDGAS